SIPCFCHGHCILWMRCPETPWANWPWTAFVAWWALLVAQTNDSERQGTVYRGCIRRDHPAIAGHFPGYPIVPGALLLTELLHALESTVGQNGRVLELSSVKFI